jgi:tetratricopeptide (TPR) repeat protein
LKLWIDQIGLSERERIDFLDEEKIETLLMLKSRTEHSLSACHANLKDFDKAHHHCDQSISYAKQMKEGEEKRKWVYETLVSKGGLYYQMCNFNDAKVAMEEAYIYIAEIHNPEHPLVLQAADELIQTLSQTGDYYDAERFARICYEALTRAPLDPESREAADAATRLANASRHLIKQNGADNADIEEAEMLARKAVCIMKKVKGHCSKQMRFSFGALMDIKCLKIDYGQETKGLLEDYLSDAIRYQGMYGRITGYANDCLGRFYFESDMLSSYEFNRKLLQNSESYHKEVLRIMTKFHGPDHCITLETAVILPEVLTALRLLENECMS